MFKNFTISEFSHTIRPQKFRDNLTIIIFFNIQAEVINGNLGHKDELTQSLLCNSSFNRILRT